MGWMHWPDCSTLQKCPDPQEEQSHTWAQPRPSRGSGHGPMPEHPPKRQSSFYPRGFFKRKHRSGSLLCISGPWWNIAHGYEILHQLVDGRNILIVPVFHGKPKRNPNCRFFPTIHSNYRLHMRHRSSNSKAGPRMSWLVRTEVLAYLEFQRSGGAVHGSIVQILRRKMKWIEITHYSWWSNFLIFINCTILYCCTIKTSDYWWLL